MRTALVHHWLVGMRGGEKVLEALCDLLPNADIFTLVCDPSRISEKLRQKRITSSFIERLPFARRRFRAYLPLFPMAARRLDLSAYDLVVSTDASVVKAVRPRTGAIHICYCHSPPRYLWDMVDLYRREEAGLVRHLLMPMFVRCLRRADHDAAQRVTHFIANSHAVAERIERHYQRQARVIYPPVETGYFGDVKRKPEDFYLFAGQLVAYKRADLAVRAMSAMGRKLLVVGDGPQRAKIERLTGSGVRMLGWVSDEELRKLYGRCRALIFPNEEDFGIVPVEAMAAGAPVIALARGGGLETVVDGVSGIHFAEESAEGLQAAVRRFEAMERSFSTDACREQARKFDLAVFLSRMGEFLEQASGNQSRDRKGAVGDQSRDRKGAVGVDREGTTPLRTQA